MNQQTRREFLADVGTGVVVAGVGANLAAELGFSTAFAQQGHLLMPYVIATKENVGSIQPSQRW